MLAKNTIATTISGRAPDIILVRPPLAELACRELLPMTSGPHVCGVTRRRSVVASLTLAFGCFVVTPISSRWGVSVQRSSGRPLPRGRELPVPVGRGPGLLPRGSFVCATPNKGADGGDCMAGGSGCQRVGGGGFFTRRGKGENRPGGALVHSLGREPLDAGETQSAKPRRGGRGADVDRSAAPPGLPENVKLGSIGAFPSRDSRREAIDLRPSGATQAHACGLRLNEFYPARVVGRLRLREKYARRAASSTSMGAAGKARRMPRNS